MRVTIVLDVGRCDTSSGWTLDAFDVKHPT